MGILNDFVGNKALSLVASVATLAATTACDSHSSIGKILNDRHYHPTEPVHHNLYKATESHIKQDSTSTITLVGRNPIDRQDVVTQTFEIVSPAVATRTSQFWNARSEGFIQVKDSVYNDETKEFTPTSIQVFHRQNEGDAILVETDAYDIDANTGTATPNENLKAMFELNRQSHQKNYKNTGARFFRSMTETHSKPKK